VPFGVQMRKENHIAGKDLFTQPLARTGVVARDAGFWRNKKVVKQHFTTQITSREKIRIWRSRQ
jgi:hypothetical protein